VARAARRHRRLAGDLSTVGPVTATPAIPLSRHLLRVRDLIDRAFAGPLDVPALARSAHVSEDYFSRSFKAAFGETPHRYLLRRRMERAKALLRAGELSVTEVCLAVGFTSLGSFSSQFRRFVGESPMSYRERAHDHDDLAAIPSCLVRRYTRPAV
jgi:AraC-like DNA-binding protein